MEWRVWNLRLFAQTALHYIKKMNSLRFTYSKWNPETQKRDLWVIEIKETNYQESKYYQSNANAAIKSFSFFLSSDLGKEGFFLPWFDEYYITYLESYLKTSVVKIRAIIIHQPDNCYLALLWITICRHNLPLEK